MAISFWNYTNKEIAAKWNSPNGRKVISEWLENSISGIESDLKNVTCKLDEIKNKNETLDDTRNLEKKGNVVKQIKI